MAKTAAAEEACEARGGVRHDIGNMVGQPAYCVAPARDAGTSCSRATDCAVACDAASRQCRATDGLGAVLDAEGREVWALQ